MKTLLLIAFAAAVVGLITSMVILYNLVVKKKISAFTTEMIGDKTSANTEKVS
ncbi:MAG: hypothetical protein MZV63_28600 [Marinilabiliales bacterium]|nr:hypothetical protein [Marinilabiliales bacterium]